ncbi:MAG: hypothetical protein FJX76_02855 [Armatimonadetes bacterium]|nr:hypothetical protein [Armatimonadota bacterium]
MRIAFLTFFVFLAVVAPRWAGAHTSRIAEVKSLIEQKRAAKASLEVERQHCESERGEALRAREAAQNEGYRITCRIDELRLDESTAQAELYHADRLYGYYQADARAETERRIEVLKNKIERLQDALTRTYYRRTLNDERIREIERRANELQSKSYALHTEIERTQSAIERLNGELYSLEHP